MRVTRIFSFSAAHHLIDYHGACERPHGHTYRLAVTVSGPVRRDGLVLDFAELKKVVQGKILDRLDHTDLNDLLPNPSAELIAQWIWERLKNIGPETKTNVKLVEIQLWEGDNTSVIYAGD